VLKEIGFTPCKAEPDIWIRLSNDGTHYEYVAVYVDDLMIAMKTPQDLVDVLTADYKFKLKGTGPITYHIGIDFSRNEEGTLCMAPRKYIDKMMETYVRLFGDKPCTRYHAPIEAGDHPELDTSEFLDAEGITTYQSLIGTLQWVVSIGRFNVQTAVMSLSSFRANPRRGHLDRVKRVFGYIEKFKSATIRVRPDVPDLSALPTPPSDWSNTIYDNAKEQVPDDAPTPAGKPVVTISYVDANLMHDMLTGKSVTGVLHFVNKTPIEWYSKKQSTVETATYGSEFVAAKTCVEQITDLRILLRYLGVPICDHSYMFGDNNSVVGSATTPDAKLSKRHVILSFHKVREAIASGMVQFYFIRGQNNPADILSKHWSFTSVWQQLQPLMFWKGNTADLVK
jgi:hypothetical protein